MKKKLMIWIMTLTLFFSILSPALVALGEESYNNNLKNLESLKEETQNNDEEYYNRKIEADEPAEEAEASTEEVSTEEASTEEASTATDNKEQKKRIII